MSTDNWARLTLFLARFLRSRRPGGSESLLKIEATAGLTRQVLSLGSQGPSIAGLISGPPNPLLKLRHFFSFWMLTLDNLDLLGQHGLQNIFDKARISRLRGLAWLARLLISFYLEVKNVRHVITLRDDAARDFARADQRRKQLWQQKSGSSDELSLATKEFDTKKKEVVKFQQLLRVHIATAIANVLDMSLASDMAELRATKMPISTSGVVGLVAASLQLFVALNPIKK